ncbi:MAG: hypothetical protein K9G46_04305 [Flavobacteriales bacterium]|jgi:hypothetical protein|nr:hypothetical protein [Flavobacteriales bacterium]
MLRVLFLLIFLCQNCFGQGKDYPNFSKIKARFDVCFSTEITVYDALRSVQFKYVYNQFAAPEYDGRIGLDIQIVKNVSLGPMIGLNYSARRNGESEGNVMTTHGDERVSYFIRSKSLGFNTGLQAKWLCLKEGKNNLILSLSTYYSHLVNQENWVSRDVRGYPTIDGRVKSVLQGQLALRYAYALGRGINIEPLIGLSFNAPLVQIAPQGVKVFPLSPSIGLAFTFGKSPATPNPDSSKPSEP